MTSGGGSAVITEVGPSFSQNINEGRLTVVSGQPIPISVDINGKPIQIRTGANGTVLYYTPYKGNRITLFYRGDWKLYSFSEFSITNLGLGDSADQSVG